jgi:membrane protease subunit (stomatin/prohibitin family)
VLGPMVLGTGLVFALIGFASFFSSFGSFSGPPRYFWCAFVGLPLTGVGMGITKFAFMGAVTRYVANEVTPVGTDVLNTVVRETKGSLREAAAAVSSGLRDGTDLPGGDTHTACPSCESANDPDARYCKNCGEPLQKPACRHCGDIPAVAARFCDNCGEPLS